MGANPQIVELLVQAGVVGIILATILFGFRWYDRSRLSGDKRIESDEKITLALINSSVENTKQTAMLNKNTEELTDYLKNRNGSLEKHMDKQDEVLGRLVDKIDQCMTNKK